ncbi:MAG: calcium-binding protein [Planctomycetota bacterium]|nr:calcium-binding protein [Planctomycetota bacterium]
MTSSSCGEKTSSLRDWSSTTAWTASCSKKSSNDILLGGDGHDRLRAGSGNDSLFGGSGSDRLFSVQGNNYLSGGDDHDRICSFGTDRIDGGAGADSIRLFTSSSQLVTDETDTVSGPFADAATRITREANNAFVDAAFARLLALDAEYELPLL